MISLKDIRKLSIFRLFAIINALSLFLFIFLFLYDFGYYVQYARKFIDIIIINKQEIQSVIMFAVSTIIIVSLFFKIVTFLSDDKIIDKKKFSIELKEEDLNSFDRQKLEKSIEKIINEQINVQLSKNSDIKELEKEITNKISSTLEKDIIANLEAKFNSNLEGELRLKFIKELLTPITKNIEIYIDRLQRNSIVNLVIGIIGTIIPITILSFAILSDKSFSSIEGFLMHFLPRFTFVIFIQLFAFFFLRLYKNNLEDTKYFQNELSNLTAKSTSIRIALLTENNELLNDIIKNLANTERNFKFSKDETLHNIENKKIETDVDKEMLTQLKEMFTKFELKK
jgi:hypothetical protein